MSTFEMTRKEILYFIREWESTLLDLDSVDIKTKRNKQDRTVKQILGHLVDSATNNIHRVIHLQYQQSPISYPDYANLGNNDRWIAIQHYNEEEWYDLVQLWKYCNLHLAHIIKNIPEECFQKEWVSALNEKVTLQEMITDYPRHLKLHLTEIDELINS